jgi:hypothetical protein
VRRKKREDETPIIRMRSHFYETLK